MGPGGPPESGASSFSPLQGGSWAGHLRNPFGSNLRAEAVALTWGKPRSKSWLCHFLSGRSLAWDSASLQTREHNTTTWGCCQGNEWKPSINGSSLLTYSLSSSLTGTNLKSGVLRMCIRFGGTKFYSSVLTLSNGYAKLPISVYFTGLEARREILWLLKANESPTSMQGV